VRNDSGKRAGWKDLRLGGSDVDLFPSTQRLLDAKGLSVVSFH
jgi:hypothetical protein